VYLLHITDVCQLPPTHASTARGEDVVVFVDCSYKLINKGLQPSFECPLPEHRYLHNFVAANGNHDAKRAALDFAFDLRRPVKPRWPEFDIDLGGKPAGMPV